MVYTIQCKDFSGNVVLWMAQRYITANLGL